MVKKLQIRDILRIVSVSGDYNLLRSWNIRRIAVFTECIDRKSDREVILELERRQAVVAFSTGYMGFRW